MHKKSNKTILYYETKFFFSKQFYLCEMDGGEDIDNG